MNADDLLTRLGDVLNGHSWAQLPDLLHPDFTCLLVHTGERFTRDEWVRFNAEYLDPPMRYDQATGKLVPSASQVAPNGLTHFLEAATYRNVLVGVGVLLCLIAAAAYWKRKKSQSRAGRPG